MFSYKSKRNLEHGEMVNFRNQHLKEFAPDVVWLQTAHLIAKIELRGLTIYKGPIDWKYEVEIDEMGAVDEKIWNDSYEIRIESYVEKDKIGDFIQLILNYFSVSDKDNKLSEKDFQFAIEQSKKIVNTEPTNDSSAMYPGRKPMIGFDNKK